jgi:hypothetical protein
MPDNYEKLPLQQSLNALATRRALAEIERTGEALPCRVTAIAGSIVTVSFEVQGGPWTLSPLTLPKAESQWLRAPTQIGDFGITVPADTYLGGISGYGGVADLTVDYGNMSSLVWVPVGSTTFQASPDPNKPWINGPAGAILGDSTSAVYIDCDVAAGTITFYAGGQTWTLSSTGFMMSSGVVAETHVHGGVQSGSAKTDEPEAD